MKSFARRERRLALYFLASLFLPTALSSSGCPTVECSTSLPSEMCYRYSNSDDTIQISNCGLNEVCEFDQMDLNQDYDLTSPGMYCRPQNYLSTLKFPGETCVVKQECLSGLCSSQVCEGLPLSSPCTDYSNCAPGLICSNSHCVQQRAKGSPCTMDDDCTNDALCFQGKCVGYFSQAVGTFPVQNDYLCESGFADKQECKLAPANKANPDSPCYSDHDCPLNDGQDGSCFCGMNTDGTPFCGSQPGDPEFATYKNALVKVIATSITCHYNISYSRRCPAQERNPDFSTYITARYIYRYRPSIIGIPSCVFEVMPFALNYTYSRVVIGGGGGTSPTVVIVVSVCVFSVLLLLGIVCFFCVRKYSARETLEYRLQLRIRAGEYSAIEVYTGSTNLSSPDSPHHECQFTFPDLVLSDKHSSILLLSKGIPVARTVEHGTETVIDQLEEGLEVAAVAEGKNDTRAGSATETGLFYRRETK